ncbi:hypothetical protein M1563_00245 [Patescibacteria group bacterium]|nr:hypothetical protein [Patescibacteria group bacterium]MCL5409693.1 hypothetical protein [Patescibacteria group bacterium]
MTATAHALIGGIIAASVPDPALGISLAFISHPLVDMIPHWDFGLNWRSKSKLTLFGESVFDLSLGLGAAYLLFNQQVGFLYLLGAVVAAESWDILEAPYWFLGWKFPPFSWIYNVQSRIQSKLTAPWGILTQAATVLGLILFFRAL